jgi:cell division protein FtsB
MTQKSSAANLLSEVLQTIDTKEIADESMRRTVEILLNLIEQQQVEIKELQSENQKLRDENNRLKGEEVKREQGTGNRQQGNPHN